MSLKLVITLLIAASFLGGAVGAGVALVVDHGKVGPRGPRARRARPDLLGPTPTSACSRPESQASTAGSPASSADGGISCARSPESGTGKQSGSTRRRQTAAESAAHLAQAGSDAIPVTNSSRRQ